MSQDFRIPNAILWAVALAYMGLIFALSSLERVSLPLGEFRWTDKVVHCGAFAVLAALLSLAAEGRGWRRPGLFGFLLSSIYGGLDELHQSYVPGRVAGLGDVGADVLGSLLGAYLVLAWLSWRRQCEPEPSPSATQDL